MSADAGRPGVFGKLASQGDFVTRALPPDFVGRWDTWLQEGMQESRARLGIDWLAHYLQAPLWRFALAPGVCGQAAMAGVLLPGIDRVGRYFPLTLAAPYGPGARSLADLPGPGAAWFDALADLALAAMGGTLSVAALDAALAQLAPGPATEWDADSGGRRMACWIDGAPGSAPLLRWYDALPDARDTGALLVPASD